ncbi:hypothetical protein LAT59_03535 [Candidatus Gracilibacteria bacterium]|nr:hypothetical protein [Candidatus Gracilibacteria bacterium]
MIYRFFVSFFRAHSWHIVRITLILFLSSLAFLLVTSISSLVENTIQVETRSILGADIILDSSQAPTESDIIVLSDISANFDLKIASTLEFQTNIMFGDTPYLTDVKVISNNYPLVGEKLHNRREGVHISSPLQTLLGDLDRLTIGDNDYQVIGEIPQGSFGGFSLFTEGREIWIPEEIVNIDNLLGLGARLSYKYFLLQDRGSIQNTRGLLEQEGVFDGWRIGDIASRQDILSDVFNELRRFLQVFFTGIYVLAFFSLFFTFEALKRITKRDIGLFILLGYNKSRVFSGLICIGFGIYTLGFLLALIASYFIIGFLQSFPLTESIVLTQFHILQSFLLSFVILIFASLYTLRDYYKASVLDLLKRPDLLTSNSLPMSIGGYMFAGIIVLLISLGAGLLSLLIISFGLLLVLSILVLITKSYFFILYKFISPYRKKYFLFYHTLRACIRPGNMTLFITIPVMVIGVLFFFLLVFAISFLDITRISDAKQTYFILNIETSEKEVLEDLLSDIEIYDILLARIMSINNIPLREYIGNDRGRGEFTREFNLTTHPLPDNTFTSGKDLESGGISLDKDFADRLGITLGDEVGFLLAGREVSFEVQNMRPPIRSDFRPFFYFQLTPDDMVGLERSYFGVLDKSLYTSPELRNKLFTLSPRLQLLDVSETLGKVTHILSQVYHGVLAISIYVGIFVWILLSVSLTILGHIRGRESQVLSLLGASRAFTKNYLSIEYFILLSFSLIGVIIIGTILSFWFFLSSSLLNFKILYILQASGLILAGGVLLYGSLLITQKK